MDATDGATGLGLEAVGRFRLTRPCPTAPGEPSAYVAFDPESSEQVVLRYVPLVKGEAKGAALFRLKSDLEISKRTSHPGLVKLRTLGIDERKGHYLIREYVDGFTLRALPSMEVDLDAALRILVQVAQALAVADQAGVAPRTLRLDQIFIAPTGQVRLEVFGQVHAGVPSAASSAHQLARAGLELIAGPLAFAKATEDGAPLRLPAALDKGLALAFGKALAADPTERFASAAEFVQVLVAEAPLPEPVQHELLELIDQREPAERDPVIAAWVQRIRQTPSSRTMVVDLVAVPAPAPAPTPAPEPPTAAQPPAVTEPPVPAATRRRPGLLIAGAVLLAGLVAGGLVLFGQKKPLVVRVESSPPGATLELNGRILGVTPLELTDPAPGARLLLTRDGFRPAEGTLRAGQTSLSLSLEPLPPPPAPEPPAATPPPEPERQAEPKAEARRPETRPAAAPKARAPAKDEKRFDLYKHLEKQSQGK